MSYFEELTRNNGKCLESTINEQIQDSKDNAGPSRGPKVISISDINSDFGVRVIKSPPLIKIPRPPNAFMIYANTWRKKLAHDHPSESNKQISVRLGNLWKKMENEEKDLYYSLAKRVDAEHKKKYPDYVYNPKEARIRKALRDRGRLQRSKTRWTSTGEPTPLLLPIMLRRRVEAHSPTMLQSYNEGYPDLSYGQHLQMAPPSEYHHVHPWYNNHIHGGGDHQNGGMEYISRGEEKPAPDWAYQPDSSALEPDSSYHQSPSESNYNGQQVGQMIPQMPIGSPMMGQVMQESMMLPAESHNGSVPLIQNGVDRIEPHSQKEDEDTLPKLNGPQATPVESSKKDVLKLPGFHQTFGNITEIGRFSQPDEFFESRPPEIPDPPPKVSESLEVKRKPRGRKRKQPEPRELYSRQEATGPPSCAGQEPQWPPPSHHWPPLESPHHWRRPHPYYQNQQHYHLHHHHQYQQPPYYHHQHHLDCPPHHPYHHPYGHYQPNPWHPAAREYVHHHSYPGYV